MRPQRPSGNPILTSAQVALDRLIRLMPEGKIDDVTAQIVAPLKVLEVSGGQAALCVSRVLSGVLGGSK